MMDFVAAAEGAGPAPPSMAGRLGVVSPDGAWIALVSAESGQNHVYVQPFPGPGPRTQVSQEASGHPRWRADGRELFFGGAVQVGNPMASAVMSVDITRQGGGVRVSDPRRVFGDAVIDSMVDSRRHADFSPDGQRMLARQRHGLPEPPVRLIVNWPGAPNR